MKCLIIAAGKGSRLQQRGDSKPLVPILGVPLIERVIRAAMEAGADEFYVVIGYQGERVTSCVPVGGLAAPMEFLRPTEANRSRRCWYAWACLENWLAYSE